MISKQLVDELFAQFGTDDINQLSIRQVGKLVSQIEQQSGVEFIHMEMGVPGLPASQIGIEAEKAALEKLKSIPMHIKFLCFFNFHTISYL